MSLCPNAAESIESRLISVVNAVKIRYYSGSGPLGGLGAVDLPSNYYVSLNYSLPHAQIILVEPCAEVIRYLVYIEYILEHYIGCLGVVVITDFFNIFINSL